MEHATTRALRAEVTTTKAQALHASARSLWDYDEPYGVQPSPLTSAAVGYGLSCASAGHQAAFILLSNAGERALHQGGAPWEVRVTGPGRTVSTVTDHEDGTATVRYMCTCSGRHRVIVRLGDAHLIGSPFEVDVAVGAPAPCFATAAVASQATVRGLLARWFARASRARPLHDARARMASNRQAMAEVQVQMHLQQIGARHWAQRQRLRGVRALRRVTAEAEVRRTRIRSAISRLDTHHAMRCVRWWRAAAAARRERVGIAEVTYHRIADRFFATRRGPQGLLRWRSEAHRRAAAW